MSNIIISSDWLDIISIYYHCMRKISSIIKAVAGYVSKPNDRAIIFYFTGYNGIVADRNIE